MTRFWAAVLIGSALLILVFKSGVLGLSYVRRSHEFPGPALAAEISRQYRAVTGREPAYVIGPQIEAGNISRYTPSRPRVVIDADFRSAPWIDRADLKAKGAILIWNPNDEGKMPAHLAEIADNARDILGIVDGVEEAEEAGVVD